MAQQIEIELPQTGKVQVSVTQTETCIIAKVGNLTYNGDFASLRNRRFRSARQGGYSRSAVIAVACAPDVWQHNVHRLLQHLNDNAG